MIKVNLLKNVGLVQAGGTSATSDVFIATASPNSRNQAIGKIAAVFVLPIAIYAYDAVVNSSLLKELADLQASLSQVQAEKAKLGDVGVKMEQYTKDKKIIDEQVETIRAVARTRLREVKSLDAIQSLIPQRTWLNRVSIQNGSIHIFGYTSAEDGIPELIRGLENSSFFSHVDPKSTGEEKIGATSVKKFELEFKAGKQGQE